MLVDWFTVGAQLLNFFVLVWLMKRFLYKPVLEAIDARENRIAGEMAAAEALRGEAGQEREAWQSRNAEFDATRAALLDAAREEARNERQRLLEQARADAEVARAKHREGLLREQEGLHAALVSQTRDAVFSIARKTLTDLADARLDEAVCMALVSLLRVMSQAERESLALSAAAGPLRVRSAFTLAPERQAWIRAALDEHLGAPVQIDFSVEPELIAGIELLTAEQRVAWNIDAYLTEMQHSVDAVLSSVPAAVSAADHAEDTPTGRERQ